MERGTIPIDKKHELEYRYHDRDKRYKYFNRKFEVYLLEKKLIGKKYIMHMDNSDLNKITPNVYTSEGKRRFDFGVTTLNWNDIKSSFLEFIIEEIGEEKEKKAKKAINKLTSPKK